MNDIFYRIKRRIDYYLYKYVLVPKCFPKVSKRISKFHTKSIESTAYELLYSNRSLGRFGDGEIDWILQHKHTPSFEHSSPLLSQRLIQVLQSNDEDFMVGLPDIFTLNKNFNKDADFFWKHFITKYSNQFFKYLDNNKQYYNTGVSRTYIDYKNSEAAKYSFYALKELWNGKNILIVEGNMSRLGVGNDLFSNTNDIKRIECPSINAFESYNKIFYYVLSFLNNHRYDDYLTLIALGPTATVLSYDLFKHDYRAIDIGHVDVEYQWYLMGVKTKVDLPDRYINEVKGGRTAIPVHDKKYFNEIIKEI